MNLDSFYTYLEQPNTLNSQSLIELNELINRYPYFQSARLLYLKNLHVLNDYRYNEELKTVSAYAGNRQILYELINDNKTKVNKFQEATFTSISENIINSSIDSNYTAETETIEEITTENIAISENNNTEQTIEVVEVKEEINNVPEINKEIIIPVVTDNSENKSLVEKEEINDITEENNIVPEISEVKAISVCSIVESNNKQEVVSETKNETIEIEKPIVKQVEVVEEKKQTEPVKESVADMILRKVAAIHVERAKSKEQVNNEVETKPIVLQEQSYINHEQLLDEIIAENNFKVKNIKIDIPIVISEEKKQKEIISETKPEIEDVTADSFITITEEEDLTNYNEIQETEYREEEIKKIEPVSHTKNFKHVIIVSDEKQIIESNSEKIKEETINNEIVISDHDSMFTIEPEKEVLSEPLYQIEEIITNENFESINEAEKEPFIIKDYSFDENTTVFTAPAYDINSLLEKEPIKTEDYSVTENIEQISMPFEKWLDFISKEPKKESKPRTNPDLIEAFIKSEPRLSFKIASETSNLEQKESLISHNEIELVSESLADIYAKQGLYIKAIKMYEKLALQYPEKNIYFANLILKTKEQNSNQ